MAQPMSTNHSFSLHCSPVDLPGRIGKPVDVLNASAGGWAPSNEVAFLRSKGTFDADLVLIVLNAADLSQPFADFQAGPGTPTKAPVTAIGEAWTRYIAPLLFRPQGVSADPGSTPSQPSNMEHETGLMLAALDSGRAYSLAHNANFGVIYIPSHSKVWDGSDYQLGKKMLVDWTKSNKVPLIDLTDDFSNHSLNELYIDQGDSKIHLRPFGHRIVASRLLNDFATLFDLKADISQ